LTIEDVAILFTDIVGSTELSQRLTPDAADELRRGHFSILRQALAEAGGTEVKNLRDLSHGGLRLGLGRAVVRRDHATGRGARQPVPGAPRRSARRPERR